LDYTPPHYSEIPERLETLFISLHSRDYRGDYIRSAVELHDGIIKIYPFEEKSEALARAALQYELLQHGLPTISFGLSEQVYNKMVSIAIKTDEHDALYESILLAIDKKLVLLLDLF
jgi:hypothetical protein